MPKAKPGLYALYLRKSRADIDKERLGEFETLAKHEQELTALAKRDGYALDVPYYKELVSGERIADRHEFQKMMRKVSNGDYAGIIVHSVSRLGRGDPMEYGWILFVLKSSRTVIVTPTKVYDPNDPDDARFLQMEMFVSNMELGNIRSRLVSGCRASARNGCFIKSRPPYGYDRAKIDGMWTLVPNDDAPTVRMVFAKAASGVTLGETARDMNASGLRTPSGGFWSSSRLHSIVTNPHYMGMIRYGYYHREKVPVDGFETKIVQTLNEDCIMVKGKHEAIVSEDVWRKANDNCRRHSSAKVKRGKHLKNPLAGLLVCRKCGKAMIRFVNTCQSNGNKIEHYRHPPFTDCKARGANMALVVSILCDALEEIAENLDAAIPLGDEPRADELESVERQLAVESNRLDKLMELYFADAITIDEFKSRRDASEDLVRELKAKAKELGRKRKTPAELAVTVRDAIGMLRDDSISADAKKAALKQFIERIEYDNLTERQRDQDIRLFVTLKEL